VVETTCQPVLEDHNSCWLECKRHFLLATLVTKSFAFVFDCSGKINSPSIFSSTEVKSQTHLQSFLLVIFGASSFWSLSASENFVDAKRGCNFVNWESTGIIFKIQIICVECIIFKIRIICIERIIFKIRIICGLEHDG
jgi:hypothetical protein